MKQAFDRFGQVGVQLVQALIALGVLFAIIDWSDTQIAGVVIVIQLVWFIVFGIQVRELQDADR